MSFYQDYLKKQEEQKSLKKLGREPLTDDTSIKKENKEESLIDSFFKPTSSDKKDYKEKVAAIQERDEKERKDFLKKIYGDSSQQEAVKKDSNPKRESELIAPPLKPANSNKIVIRLLLLVVVVLISLIVLTVLKYI